MSETWQRNTAGLKVGGIDPQATTLKLDEKTGFMGTARFDGISPEIKTKSIELYRESGNLSATARSLGIEPRVLRWHMVRDEAYKRALDEARAEISDRAEGSIVRNLDSSNPTWSIFWLKCNRPEIYGDHQRLTVTQNHEVTARIAETARAYTEAEVVEATGPASIEARPGALPSEPIPDETK